MKTMFRTLTVAVCCLTAMYSCSNAEIEDKGKADADGRIELNVEGVLGEYEAEETKSSLVNNIRVGWERHETKKDTVLVFHKEKQTYLGYLVATVRNDDDRYATLSGTITAPEGDEKTLVFIHGTGLNPSGFTEKATYDYVTLDLSAQGDKTPFMVYGTSPFRAAEVSNIIVDFSFATSVVSTYAAGLPANTEVTKATLSGINTKCEFDISTLEVSGNASGTITKSAGIGSTNAQGQVLFKIAVPESGASSGDRNIVFTIGTETCTADFSGAAVESGKSYSAMAEYYAVEEVVLDKPNIAIIQGATETLTATVRPLKSNPEVHWSSSDATIATVDETGKVTGMALGTAIITATSQEDSKISATCTVTVEKYVAYVEIGGRKWATMNLGAEDVNGYGNLYSWGNLTGQSGDSNYAPAFTDDNYSGTDGAKINNSTVSWDKEKNDAAYNELGGKWRMPNIADFEALGFACGIENMEKGNYGSLILPALSDSDIDKDAAKVKKGIYWKAEDSNILYGIKELKNISVAGLLYSDGDKYLFFPAAGISDDHEGGASRLINGAGGYWTSNLETEAQGVEKGVAKALLFNADALIPLYHNCYCGQSIRPVSD